jgi:hypothetical protein
MPLPSWCGSNTRLEAWRLSFSFSFEGGAALPACWWSYPDAAVSVPRSSDALYTHR